YRLFAFCTYEKLRVQRTFFFSLLEKHLYPFRVFSHRGYLRTGHERTTAMIQPIRQKSVQVQPPRRKKRSIGKPVIPEIVAQLLSVGGTEAEPPGGQHFTFRNKLFQQTGADPLQVVHHVNGNTVSAYLIPGEGSLIDQYMVYPFL